MGVSRWRFLDVSAPLGGLELQLAGAVGEEVRVLALQPSGTREWTILEKQASHSLELSCLVVLVET